MGRLVDDQAYYNNKIKHLSIKVARSNQIGFGTVNSPKRCGLHWCYVVTIEHIKMVSPSFG